MNHKQDERWAGQWGIGRRDFLCATGASLLGLAYAGRPAWGADAAAQPAKPKMGNARSVIQLALWGGMTQFETFDPKPNAAPEFRSPFKPIPTNVPGTEICELLPMMAKIADKYAILRSVINPRTGHGEAQYVMVANAPFPSDVTSAHPSGKLVYPAAGAIVGMRKREDGVYKGDIPPWVCIGNPPYGVTEGFLGPKWKPFCANTAGRSALPKAEAERLGERRGLLTAVEPAPDADEKRAAVRAAAAAREEMFRVLGSDAQKVFDLTAEPDAVRDRYGRSEFGQQCLLARRLAEYGVPFISVPWSGVKGKDGNSYGWDMHEQLIASCKELCPVLDQAVSALLEDLEQRKLLDRTIVTLFAENGKAPEFTDLDKGSGKPNGTRGGRQHWGNGFSVVVAGGGFKGGKVVGEMDDNGQTVKSRPIYPWDLWDSIYLLMGIDPHDRLVNPYGCVAYVSQADACGLPRGGLLTEIM